MLSLDTQITMCYSHTMRIGQPYNLPTDPNPFLSMRNYLGLTVDQVSNDLEVHRNTILRTEQGQYTNPPNDLLDYYFPSSVRKLEILEEYSQWRLLCRKANYGLLDPLFDYRFLGGIAFHPFKEWRDFSKVKALNTIAKAFALHHGTLFKYESQPERCETTPPQIIEALRDSGYSNLQLENLELAFQLYKRKIRNSILSNVRRVG